MYDGNTYDLHFVNTLYYVRKHEGELSIAMREDRSIS